MIRTFSLILISGLIFGLLSASPGFSQTGISISTSNKSAVRIVVSPDASSTENYAALELQRALEKIVGIRLEILKSAELVEPSIIIGTPQSTLAVKEANLFNTNNPEEVRIHLREQVLFLAGPTERAALKATYTFLQEELGARWYWPGETGEYFPVKKEIIVSHLDVRQVPDVAERSLSINSPHYDEDTLVWMGRNRLNWHHVQGRIIPERVANMKEKGLQVVVGGHNATLAPELLEEHPEYMAEYAGKRQKPASHPPHLCWSNPGVQEALAQKVRAWWDENPLIDSISFFGADHNHFCECQQCAAFGPDVTTRWQKFSKNVIEKVNQTHPGKHYQTLAYQAYRNVPQEVAPFDLIGYTTYNIDYTKPITHEFNAKAREEILAWRKLGARMGIRGYQFIPFNKRMYAPLTSLIMEEVVWAHENGLQGWKSELTPFGHPKKVETLPQDENWVTNRMSLYAVAQTMWNTKLTPREIMQDWSENVFRASAQPMLEYYEKMDEIWRSSPIQLTYFLQPPASFAENFISDELLKFADQRIQTARGLLNNIADESTKARVTEQINLEAAMLDNWREIFILQQGRASHLQTYALPALNKPLLTASPSDSAWNLDVLKSIPEFETAKGEKAENDTKAYILWDEEALYIRFINYDDAIGELKVLRSGHDENVFGDDNLELFLDDPSHSGRYFHLAVNAKGARYDARSDGSMNFDKSWDPEWEAKTTLHKDSWILDVKLPFSSFGISGKKGTEWKMAFKRGGARRRENSGWPDASYHNPAGFGKIILAEKAPVQKRILFYDAGGNSNAIRTELASLGFTSQQVAGKQADFESSFSLENEVLVLRRPSSAQGFDLSEEVIHKKVLPFLEKGGLVLIVAGGNLPLKSWFNLDSKLKWSGWKIDSNRKTTAYKNEGNWYRHPHDLTAVITRGTTPSSGYNLESDDWEVLAQLRMADGLDSPYLLRSTVGKGTLILTTSNFGYGGGHEMFGSMNPANAAKLLDNLLAEHRKQ